MVHGQIAPQHRHDNIDLIAWLGSGNDVLSKITGLDGEVTLLVSSYPVRESLNEGIRENYKRRRLFGLPVLGYTCLAKVWLNLSGGVC